MRSYWKAKGILKSTADTVAAALRQKWEEIYTKIWKIYASVKTEWSEVTLQALLESEWSQNTSACLLVIGVKSYKTL